MAKKKSKIFTDVLETVEIEQEIANNIVSSDAINSDVEVSEFMQKREEIKFEDAVDAKEELVKLNNEKSDLTDKLAEYIEEIEALKKQIAELQDENDKHLMKIAELSFENATLQANLKNVNVNVPEKQENNNVQTNMHVESKNVNYQTYVNNMYRQNGYSDWT